MKHFQYDVAFSFAGEDRIYVESVAEILRGRGIRVFYDKYEEASLWGKDLYVYLSDIYKNRARYTVVVISQSYAKKLWTKHELRSAQARAFEEQGEYILSVRLDDSEIPGIFPTTGFVDLSAKPLTNELVDQLAELILEKLSTASGVICKEIGTLWSNRVDISAHTIIVRFNATFVAKTGEQGNKNSTIYELYQLTDGRFIVYAQTNHNLGDWGTSNLAGVNAWGEMDPPLTIEEVQRRFPPLATAAGLSPIVDFEP